MKSLRLILFSGVALLLMVGACAPQPAPGTTEVPATPSLVPIDLAGPEMTVGSSWLYADGALLVAVPAGIFTMGHGGPDDPQHQVNLPDFWIYRTKVTNGQYAYCVAAGQCTLPVAHDDPAFGDALHANDPVVGVDYSQAAAYCGFVHARLPTEAEWEKTARGPDANIYPWGNGAPSCDLLNYESCQGKTTPVNAYPKGQSYYQAFDMEGNAFEWVADWYKQDYYVSAPPDNPPGPEKGFVRTVRSSAFNSGTNQTQAYNRFDFGPADHRNSLGFRCVVDDPTYFAPFCNYPATYGTDGVGGAATGPQSTVVCPDLSIQQNPSCELRGSVKIPVTHVTLTGDAHSNFTVPDEPCDSQGGRHTTMTGSDETDWVCTGAGQVSICDKCTVTLTGSPACPSGYTFDPSSSSPSACIPNAVGTGQCLPGFTLGTQGTGSQCCTYDPGSPTPSTDFGVHFLKVFPCPAGTSYDGQHCISVPFQTSYCKSEAIQLKDCTPHRACKPPSGGCGGFPFVWDEGSCKCVNSSP